MMNIVNFNDSLFQSFYCNHTIEKITDQSFPKLLESSIIAETEENSFEIDNSKMNPKENSQNESIRSPSVENVENLSKQNKITSMYESRLNRFNEFKAEEKFLCHRLDIPSRYQNFVIISSLQMEEFKDYLKILLSLKEKRQACYLELITEIKYLSSHLQIFQWSMFEKSALNSNEFILSLKNLNKLNEWKFRLLHLFQLEKDKVDSLKQKIIVYWDKLSVSEDIREEFFSRFSDDLCIKVAVQELEKELSYCKNIWQEKNQYHVLNLRSEILMIWKKCCINRNYNFPEFFYSNNCTEKLLILHEEERKRLLDLLEKKEELNILINQWTDLESKLKEFENKSKNISRFHNRGGTLLKEEKSRKNLQKKISATKSKILKLALNYKKETESNFYHNGQSIIEIMNESSKRIQNCKENEKPQKFEFKSKEKKLRMCEFNNLKKGMPVSALKLKNSNHKR